MIALLSTNVLYLKGVEDVSNSRDKHQQFINQLCYQGEKVMESERFGGVHYMVKDGHLCIMTSKDGQLAVRFDIVKELIKEIEEVYDLWADVKTKKCIV